MVVEPSPRGTSRGNRPPSTVTALDVHTGRRIWTWSPSLPPGVLAIDGKVVIGVSGAEAGVRGFVDAYDAATGERVWRLYTVPVLLSPPWAGVMSTDVRHRAAVRPVMA